MKKEEDSPYAFVGLGAMGMGMAKNLLKGGFPVIGIARRQEVLDEFAAAGGRTARRLDEVAGKIAGAFLMPQSAEQVEEILFLNHTVEKMRPGGCLIICSTVSPLYMEGLDKRLREKNLDLVDCPVSGGKRGADQGSLSLFAASRREVFNRVKKPLESMADKIYYVGEKAGQGSSLKVLHQLLAVSHIALAVEAFALCLKKEMDPELFYDVVTHSAGNSWMFEYFGKPFLEGDLSPLSRVSTCVKDLGLVLDMAEEKKMQIPLAASAFELFLRAKEAGDGEKSPLAAIFQYALPEEKFLRAVFPGEKGLEGLGDKDS